MVIDNKKLRLLLQNVQQPARYVGGELGSTIKEPTEGVLRYAMCFPDLYEIGMSHLGIKILYAAANKREDVWCERFFAPAEDMQNALEKYNIPLFSLESYTPLHGFDLIGFTLQYELTYTTILNMLKLGGVPLKASDRGESDSVVIAGGPCASNPEPLADFIDFFVLGDGEAVSDKIFDIVSEYKAKRITRAEMLQKVSKIEGVYVPSFYEVSYSEGGTISDISSVADHPATVRKTVMGDLDSTFFPTEIPVPLTGTVHDRAVLEIFRGCGRGCRFCQAGYIYRPIRERSPQRLNSLAKDLCKSTGYDEISLSSLSTSDYTALPELLDLMTEWTEPKKVSISLPSLRIDNFSPELLAKVTKLRKPGLTFAPEAGTARMRDVINKNITEQEVMDGCRAAFEGGYSNIKLYFMMGLPEETMEDIEGIANLAQKVVECYFDTPKEQRGKSVSVTISVACFIPKPFTPFQFEPQDSLELLREKQRHLLKSVKSKKISVKYHDAYTSILEAALTRGDRRLGAVIAKALEKGSKLDGWAEHFSWQAWVDAFDECGLSMEFYANRRREYDEILPWEHLDYGVDKQYFVEESKKSKQGLTTQFCAEGCNGCGADKLCPEGCKYLAV